MTDKVSNELTADMAKALPGGQMDDSTYSQIEDALDKIEAPMCDAVGRYLTLVERIAALRNAQSETVAFRWRLTDSETWHTEKADPSGRIGGAHIVIEPLYTHPAPQSEAVAVKALMQHAHKMLGYHIVSPPTPDHQFVNVCNGDLRVLAELFETSALTHPAPPLAVTEEMVERASRIISPNCMWDAGYVNDHIERRRDNAREKGRAALTAALEAK
jgi:hypothetical protein